MAMKPYPCTGSYTGEFDPRVRGPWANCYDEQGRFIELGMQPMPLMPYRDHMERIANALEFFQSKIEAGEPLKVTA